ncbi:unnamed protein product [Prunus brigantina]
MHAERWRQPTCFNVHIAHNNGNDKGNGRGSSLSGQAFTWYSNLSPNSIQEWSEMERASMVQYYRPEPENTINVIIDMKQGDHETIPDFIARFKKLKKKCKIPMEEKHFIKMAQNALRLSLHKKFDDLEFVDLQDVGQRVGKYELLLKEEIQRKNTSKPTYFKNPIHQVEIVKESDEESRECMHPKVSMAKIIKLQAPSSHYLQSSYRAKQRTEKQSSPYCRIYPLQVET